jgi:hypothetical protein
MKTIPQVDLLLDKYKTHLRTISKEQEKLALSYDEMDDDDFEISIPISKKMVKRFIRYYNFTCLFEYLQDGVMLTKGKEHDEYYKDLCKVYNTLTRLKNNFYNEMSIKFEKHNIALFDWEDENVGESECDLMTLWANSIKTQVKNSIKYMKQEQDDE